MIDAFNFFAPLLGFQKPPRKITVVQLPNEEDWTFVPVYNGERWQISVF